MNTGKTILPINLLYSKTYPLAGVSIVVFNFQIPAAPYIAHTMKLNIEYR